MEEGEIELPVSNPGGGDCTWGPQERAATALNWALYEALSGDGAAALAAAEAALGIAEAAGCDMVRSTSSSLLWTYVADARRRRHGTSVDGNTKPGVAKAVACETRHR